MLPHASWENLVCYDALCWCDAHGGDGGHTPCAWWLPRRKAELGTPLSLGGAGSGEEAWHGGVCCICSCPGGTSPSTSLSQRQPPMLRTQHQAQPHCGGHGQTGGNSPTGKPQQSSGVAAGGMKQHPATHPLEGVRAGKHRGGALRAHQDALPAWGRGWLPSRCQHCVFTQPQPLATVIKKQPDSFFP